MESAGRSHLVLGLCAAVGRSTINGSAGPGRRPPRAGLSPARLSTPPCICRVAQLEREEAERANMGYIPYSSSLAVVRFFFVFLRRLAAASSPFPASAADLDLCLRSW